MAVVEERLKRHQEERGEKPMGENENEEVEGFIKEKNMKPLSTVTKETMH